jgi:hypothetical protein
MTPRAFALLAFLPLCACFEVDHWYKPGASQAKLNDDFLNCRVRATQSVPVNTQIRTTPVHITPQRTDCFTQGGATRCQTTGGQRIGGRTTSYDANASLRQEVQSQCMRKLGYQAVSLPVCKAQEAKSSQAPKAVPQLTPASCVVETTTGWAIVTP